MEPGRQRLRLRLPNGAELEAEGSTEFVASERREFLALQEGSSRPGGGLSLSPESDPGTSPPWETLIESHLGSHLQLRAKMQGDKTEKDACLLLLAAAKTLLRTSRPTAAQLARWLRASGYPIGRVDRALQNALEQGEILASGSRRARRYELSGPGLAKAYALAYQFARFLKPAASL